MIITGWFLARIAAAESAAVPDATGFLQYGAVGIIAALGVFFFRTAYKRESDRADRVEAKYDRIMDQVIPVLLESAAAARQNMELLKEVQERIVPLLLELERQQGSGRRPLR